MLRGSTGEKKGACCKVRPVFRSQDEIRATIEICFPRLAGRRWHPRSPFDDTYQCIAWAAGDTSRKWWPTYDPPISYWPESAPLEDTVDAFVTAFEALGYRRTKKRAYEFGRQKVAIYAKSTGAVTHMARQHFLGRGWLSKPGDLEDILHPDLESIEGDDSPATNEYGTVAQVLERSWWAAAEFGLLRCWWAAFLFWLLRVKRRAAP